MVDRQYLDPANNTHTKCKIKNEGNKIGRGRDTCICGTHARRNSVRNLCNYFISSVLLTMYSRLYLYQSLYDS